MVISDNKTRWNSTYISIQRALKLMVKIQVFSIQFKDDLGLDFLLPNDWEVLQHFEQYLQPFHQTTKHLEGHAYNGHHGAIWEALPAIKKLLRHFEKLKQSVLQHNTHI
jgi:hypothetical protein